MLQPLVDGTADHQVWADGPPGNHDRSAHEPTIGVSGDFGDLSHDHQVRKLADLAADIHVGMLSTVDEHGAGSELTGRRYEGGNTQTVEV